jgi:hypothetical protein
MAPQLFTERFTAHIVRPGILTRLPQPAEASRVRRQTCLIARDGLAGIAPNPPLARRRKKSR